ncbi:heme o synthase [Oceanospirillum sp. HFRX-1_2]
MPRLAARHHPTAAGRASFSSYYNLCKPKVVAVMLLTAVVGMFLAVPGLPPVDKVIFGLIGIGLAAGSAAAINHLLDEKIDSIMARTRYRPLPQGQLQPTQVLGFAFIIGTLGIGILFIAVNALTAWLTLASLIGYAVIYTAILKRATPQNITIGGLAGAAPPLLGWTAISGQLDPHGLLLVLIIFAWTPPHFWALALHRKEEYAKADIPMLPVTHGDAFTKLQIILYTILMILTTILPYVTGMSGLLYIAGVMILNARFVQYVWKLYQGQDKQAAIRTFWFSIRYIMWLFVVLLADHYLFIG